jgi:hypothetical protein
VIHPDGYILTNHHVIAGASHVEVAFFHGAWQPASVVAQLSPDDLALLKIATDKPLATLPLGRSHDLELGEPVLSVGSAGGLPHTLSTGVISGLGRATTTEHAHLPSMVQVSASTSGGSSGGPLINALGEQIGVVTSRKADGENLAFAITVDRLRQVLPQLIAAEERYGIAHGIGLEMLEPAAKIAVVATDSPAAKAGLAPGDVITQIDGKPLRHGCDFCLALVDCKPGQRLALSLLRGSDEVSAEVELAATPVMEPVAVESVEPGLSVTEYAGSWDRLPDFSTLQPVRKHVLKEPVRVAGGDNDVENFAALYTGFVKIPAEGLYTFYTASDDGSRLSIGERRVVDNDGLHAASAAAGMLRLKAGLYPLRIEFFEGTGAQSLQVAVEGPGIAKRELPPEWLFHAP